MYNFFFVILRKTQNIIINLLFEPILHYLFELDLILFMK